MAGYNLQQILGYLPLTGVIQATMSGVPNPLPPAFMKGTQQVIGDAGRYTRFTGERRVASLVRYGASARSTNQRDVGIVDVKLLHSYEKQPVSPVALQSIRNFDDWNQQRRGIQELSRQIKEFGKKMANLRIATTQLVLANGILYFDGYGNLLPSSAGAVDTLTFNMNANNQTHLNGIITAIWSLPNTNIPLQLVNLEIRAAQLTGYPLKEALYGQNIPTYFTNNDFVIDYLARQPNMSVDWLKNAGQIPAGLFGYRWTPVYTGFWEDANGTNQAIWNADRVTFTPEVNDDWWEVLEGSFPVPTSVDIVGDALAAMQNTKDVYGPFAYGQVTHDPPGICTWMGDTFLPVIKNPDTLYQATVT